MPRGNDFHPLATMERDIGLPGQSKRLFRWLCEEAGLLYGWPLEGAKLRITMRELGGLLGRARSSVAEWIVPLVEAGMLAVEDEQSERTRRKHGTNGVKIFKIVSLRPGDGWKVRPANRQYKFPFGHEPPEDPLEELTSDASAPDGASGHRTGQEQPDTSAPGALAKPVPRGASGCREPSTKPDTLTSQVSGFVNQTRQPEVPRNSGLPENEGPRCRERYTKPDTLRPKKPTKDNTCASSIQQGRIPTGADLGFNDIGDFEQNAPDAGVKSVGNLMVDLLNARAAYATATRPVVQRAAIVAEIKRACGVPQDEDWWVAGATADSVEAGLDWALVQERLAAMSRRSRLPADDPNRISRCPAWFGRAMDRLARSRRVRFGSHRYERAAGPDGDEGMDDGGE